MKITAPALILIAALGLSSCTSMNPMAIDSPSNNGRYTSDQVGTVSEVQTGTIVAVRSTKISPKSSSTGAILGGVGGALAGGAIGGSTRTNLLSAAGVGLGGALVGAGAQKAIMTRDGVKLDVRIGRNRVISITQYGKASDFYPGQQVQVSMGANGVSHVTPY